MNADIYDVSTYTDAELYDVLDLVNPSDAELEAKIVMMLQKYESDESDEGQELYHFYDKIYNRFFEDDNEDQPQEEGFQGMQPAQQSDYVDSKGVNETTTPDTQSIIYTQALQHTAGQTNPILKETIRRIISIDSQYRDIATCPSSTNYTFNLSDTLVDVVSLSLYSIQIPYSWYTINNAFGGNFFYIKGDVDGINDGNHDYKISVDSGNYTADNLASLANGALNNQISITDNTSLNIVKQQNQDISFNTTNINYSNNTSLTTITVDITNIYNQQFYDLYFPTWTTPTNPVLRNTTIPGFLGYNNPNYTPCSIRSDIFATSINTEAQYTINTTNNYFIVYTYQGTGGYSTSTVIDTIRVSLSTLATGTQYTRIQITNAINTSLANLSSSPTASQKDLSPQQQLLVGSSISTITNAQNQYQYELTIKLQRKTTTNLPNMHTAIVFPNESATSTTNVWRGQGSCFNFNSLINEMNDVVSETPQAVTNYIISNTPTITLTSIRPNYVTPENNITFTIPNSTVSGYTLAEYLSAINTVVTSNTPKNKDGTDKYTIVVDNNTSNSVIAFHIDIHNTFDETMYIMDMSSCYLFIEMGIQGTYQYTGLDGDEGVVDVGGDPNHHNTFTGSFPISGNGYTITENNNKILITPRASIEDYNTGVIRYNGNRFSESNTVIITPGTYTSYQDLRNAINNAFHQFNGISTQGNSLDLTETTIQFTPVGSMIECILTVIIKNTLTETDCVATFFDANTPIDPNTGLPIWTSPYNTWYKYLFLPVPTTINATDSATGQPITALFGYNLFNYSSGNASTVFGTSAILSNTITITNQNDTFYIKPQTNAAGVYTPKNTNDIKITLPIGTYTQAQLYNTINGILTANSISKGSSIFAKTIDGLEYTCIRMNINRIYTSKDYRVVFYDPYSFVKCNTGVTGTSNARWDSTLGWLLGFHSNTEYDLSDTTSYVTANNYQINGNAISITGDTATNVNLYNYFLIMLNDYTQNHLNDGLVTVTTKETSIPLPSYATLNTYTCDPVTGKLSTASTVTSGNKLTQNQIYAANEILQSQTQKNTYSTGPYVQDVFGLIPIKPGSPGTTYVEFGGTLQNQNRAYFGPVNIRRMSVKLIDDHGTVVDLNNSNWSFSLVCEQLYNPQKQQIQ
jgi:hypothetical protein